MKQKNISKPSNIYDRSHPPAGGAPTRKDQWQHRSGMGDSDGAPVSDRRTRIPIKNKDELSASRTLGSRKEEKFLHPSWEAKRKLQNVAIVPAQGTRIVFD